MVHDYWMLRDDPEFVRGVRDDIESRVRELLRSLGV